MRLFGALAAALAVEAAAALGAAQAAPLATPLDRPALATRRAAQATLIDITRAGDRLVAVGERGVVVLSDDGGKSWRQAKVPVSVTLTAVQFPTPKDGWAVGHAGMVLASADQGETWQPRLDGQQAVQLALQTAEGTNAVEAAKLLVKEGPDKPFLALSFTDAATGYVAGAYGLAFVTRDGGKSWRPLLDRIDNPKGLHFYVVAAAREAVYLAGEQGLFLRSLDGGTTFERIETPYRGTWFALAVPAQNEVVLAGLRGNVYWSQDRGASWQAAQVLLPVSFNAVTRLADGALLFVNQAGRVLISRDRGRTLAPLPAPPGPPLTAVGQAADGTIVAVGVLGTARLPK